MADAAEKVVILGSGPAGATAAIYAARAMLEPVMIGGIQPGGQLTITTEVENYPGFAEAIQGPWLMEQMQAQAEPCGHTHCPGHRSPSVDLAQRPFTLVGDGGTRYRAQTLIIATGAQANGSDFRRKRTSRGSAFPHARLAMGFSFATSGSQWWAAAILPPRRRCFSPISPIT